MGIEPRTRQRVPLSPNLEVPLYIDQKSASHLIFGSDINMGHLVYLLQR